MSRFHGSLLGYILGFMLIVFGVGTITLVLTLGELDRVVLSLQTGEKLNLGQELTEPDPGNPQTLMLVGSDRRPAGVVDGSEGERADTIILVRLDPDKKVTSMLSLPRDLQVNIPGYGIDRINAAYSIGGTKLVLRTVKQLMGIKINHVINVDFQGFQEAVDAIGCVYADIDQRYFNNDASFAAIDISAGYQKLCGANALDYVRYRHSDNDLVRAARQQSFLRQARQQVGIRRLVNDRVRLIKIFGKHTRSDIKSRKEVLRLINLTLASLAHPIREIHFQGTLGPSYITASSAQIQNVVDQFMGRGQKKPGRVRANKPAKRANKPVARRTPANVERAVGFGKEVAREIYKRRIGFPVYYPRLRVRDSQYPGSGRAYTIHAPQEKFYQAYRLVLKTAGGEYYGVQGTSWPTPPLLQGPFRVVRSGDRSFQVYYDGARVRLVAWKSGGGTYWISNTLLQSIDGKSLLAMARSMIAYP